MLAPDAQVHVDDVVVRDGEALEAVRDRERAPLVHRSVVPDDADAVVDLRHPEAVRQAETAELGVRATPVHGVAFADRNVLDRLALSDRDVAVRAAEVAAEVEGDVLAHEKRAVRADLDRDLGSGQRVRLGRGRRRREERRREEEEDEPLQLENWTDGASRVTSSVSK